MNATKMAHRDLTVEVVAHSEEEKLILVRVTATDFPEQVERPLRVALVLDRSGSMGGQKLDIARRAAAKFVRSLKPTDKVAAVSYDDVVSTISPFDTPSEGIARLIERLETGGSTNLYGGWLAGAKAVGPGGRVILLSDGLANVGRFTDAGSLAHHARLSLRKFEVSTSTIGVGGDYDERLMSAMANQGGGAHYFAHEADAIMEAFSRERFAMGAAALDGVTLVIDGEEHKLGSLFGGEIKAAVVPLDHMPKAMKLKWNTASSEAESLDLDVPDSFGMSHEATAERLVARVAEFEDRSVDIRSQEAAKGAAEAARVLLIAVLKHTLADEPRLQAVAGMLERSKKRLEQLAREYDEVYASVHRKRGMQAGYSLREGARAHSCFFEDRADLFSLSHKSISPSSSGSIAVDPAAFQLAPPEKWLELGAAPVAVKPDAVHVVVVDFRSGFAAHDLETLVGRRVVVRKQLATAPEIEAAIVEAQARV